MHGPYGDPRPAVPKDERGNNQREKERCQDPKRESHRVRFAETLVSANKKNAPPDPLGGALGRQIWNYLSAGFRSTNQTIAGFVNAAVCGADVPATDLGK